MPSEVLGLDPKGVWKHFYALTQTPRAPKQEAAVREYIVNFAKDASCKVSQDKFGNVVIYVPASAGRENEPTTLLQSHMDMVCEKEPDSERDPAKDPLDLEIVDGWVTAKGTTLGADNGVGLAASLAMVEEKDSPHGPIEVLVTTEEEIGLLGAQALDTSLIKSKRMINLDDNEPATIIVGCAGGRDSYVRFPLLREAAGDAYKAKSVKISGLTGGHSGGDIHLNRANAIKTLALLLEGATQTSSFRLNSYVGGDKHNAIPRHASAEIVIQDADFKKFEETIQETFRRLKEEYKGIENEMALSISDAGSRSHAEPLTHECGLRLLRMLVALPTGVLAMDRAMPGIVETSTSLGVAKSNEKTLELTLASRSSVAEALASVATRIETIVKLAGGEAETDSGYPGWKPNLDSPLLRHAQAVHRQLFDEEIETEAIHAGLECGVLGKKMPGMDMIAIGPQIMDLHSPTERVEVASVEKFYQFLKGILATEPTA